MRIDKWLWCMRIYKTRSIATDACKGNKILVNGSVVKSAREVKEGDIITVRKMPVLYSYKITQLPKSRQGAANVPLFMIDITPQSEKDKLLQQVSFYIKRDKGTGRPTKKERRDIDSLMGYDDYDLDDEWQEEEDNNSVSPTPSNYDDDELDDDDDGFNF